MISVQGSTMRLRIEETNEGNWWLKSGESERIICRHTRSVTQHVEESSPRGVSYNVCLRKDPGIV